MTFNFTHVDMLGPNHCRKERRESFKNLSGFQYDFCWSGYEEREVAIYPQQIQSK